MGLGAVSRLGLIGFVLRKSPEGLIFISLCNREGYVHLGCSEIGFVLHKKSAGRLGFSADSCRSRLVNA